MSIGSLCNREVICINKEESIFEAARLMRHYHVGDVVVTEQAHGQVLPIAILTDRDIVIEMLAKEIDPDSIAVKDIMSYSLVTAREDEDIFDVVEIMHEKGIRRVPVINQKEELVGIFTVDDLIVLLAEQMTNVSRTIFKEHHKERCFRD